MLFKEAFVVYCSAIIISWNQIRSSSECISILHHLKRSPVWWAGADGVFPLTQSHTKEFLACTPFRLHPSFSTKPESAQWAPGVTLQWHHRRSDSVSRPMHHQRRAVSPNDRARRGRMGGEWIWNSWDGSSERIADRKKEVFLLRDLRGNRQSKSKRTNGASL